MHMCRGFCCSVDCRRRTHVFVLVRHSHRGRHASRPYRGTIVISNTIQKDDTTIIHIHGSTILPVSMYVQVGGVYNVY